MCVPGSRENARRVVVGNRGEDLTVWGEDKVKGSSFRKGCDLVNTVVRECPVGQAKPSRVAGTGELLEELFDVVDMEGGINP